MKGAIAKLFGDRSFFIEMNAVEKSHKYSLLSDLIREVKL